MKNLAVEKSKPRRKNSLFEFLRKKKRKNSTAEQRRAGTRNLSLSFIKMSPASPGLGEVMENMTVPSVTSPEVVSIPELKLSPTESSSDMAETIDDVEEEVEEDSERSDVFPNFSKFRMNDFKRWLERIEMHGVMQQRFVNFRVVSALALNAAIAMHSDRFFAGLGDFLFQKFLLHHCLLSHFDCYECKVDE